MDFPRLPLPSFPTREQARSHAHTREQPGTAQAASEPGECIFSQEQSMSTMFIQLIESASLPSGDIVLSGYKQKVFF